MSLAQLITTYMTPFPNSHTRMHAHMHTKVCQNLPDTKLASVAEKRVAATAIIYHLKKNVDKVDIRIMSPTGTADGMSLENTLRTQQATRSIIY